MEKQFGVVHEADHGLALALERRREGTVHEARHRDELQLLSLS